MKDNVTDGTPELVNFHNARKHNITRMAADENLKTLARRLMIDVSPVQYSYQFDWLGRPIIQIPQDIVAYQEVVWAVKPDLIIETGIAHGGSLVLSASLLALLEVCDAATAGTTLDPRSPNRRVIGIDIEIRNHNRALIEAHPLSWRVEMIEGSSVADDVVHRVRSIARDYQQVLVCLDSNHTHAHVLQELEAYASLVTPGSYCIVWDTVIEDSPEGLFPGRPWGPGNNPKTAVWEFLHNHPEFEIDKEIDQKLLLSVAPDGYLRRVR
jgi:cephalosporin hydroxylase